MEKHTLDPTPTPRCQFFPHHPNRMATNPATNLRVVSATRNVTLTWTASTSAPSVTYTIYRSSSGGCLFKAIGTTGTDVVTYYDLNVDNGTVYQYYVVATKAGVDSVPTITVSTTYVGGPTDQYKPELQSQDALSDRRANTVVAAGVVKAGCGEYQRLQKLKGNLSACLR